MAELILKSGHAVLVDDADFVRVSGYHWILVNRSYPVTVVPTGQRIERGPSAGELRFKQVALARLLLDVSDPNVQVRFRNGNSFDHRRENLKIIVRVPGGRRKTFGRAKAKESA